jgi:sulfhydrogenase subunit beta (sulfur reductase)
VKILKLPKEKLDLFASVVQQFGELHAPVEQDGKYVFKRLTRWSDARLEYDRTILPPKKYFLPPRETLFRYRPGEGFVPCTDGMDQRIILFGVHACDVYAINILERVFAGKYQDPYFHARRKNVAIIGIDCTPDKQCFCRSMRADFVDHGFDLFFYDTGDYYQALVGTALGDDMVLATGSLFEAVDAEDIDHYKGRSLSKRRAFQLDVEIRDLPEIFEMEYQSESWAASVCRAAVAAWSAPPATATMWPTTWNWARAPANGCACGIPASSPAMPWWPAERTSAARGPAASSTVSITSSAGSWRSTAGRAAWAAGGASAPARWALTWWE